MTDFNQWKHVGGVAWNFKFTKVFTPGGEKYFISVLDQQNIIASFEMKDKGYGTWVIVQPAPQWITNLQTELDSIIKTHEPVM
jgi:hypothetical protein